MNKLPAIPAIGGSVRLVLARMRHGRPRVLTARVLAAFAMIEITLHSGVGPAPVAGALAGIVIWLVLTMRGDLAPPPGR